LGWRAQANFRRLFFPGEPTTTSRSPFSRAHARDRDSDSDEVYNNEVFQCIMFAHEKPKVNLSCLQCQQRKRKCDKSNPCQACRQAGLSCTAISRARLPRGRHAQRDGDLRQRVARLEKLVSSQRNGAEPAQPMLAQVSSWLSREE